MTMPCSQGRRRQGQGIDPRTRIERRSAFESEESDGSVRCPVLYQLADDP